MANSLLLPPPLAAVAALPRRDEDGVVVVAEFVSMFLLLVPLGDAVSTFLGPTVENGAVAAVVDVDVLLLVLLLVHTAAGVMR